MSKEEKKKIEEIIEKCKHKSGSVNTDNCIVLSTDEFRQALQSLQSAHEEEMREAVEKLRKKRLPLPNDPRKITEKYERAREEEVYKGGYNQAIDDVIKSLTNKQL